MIILDKINKSFDGKRILSNFSLDIKKNEFISIVGSSGSGKTTLLNIIGLLDRPDDGVVKLFNYENPTPKTIMHLRRHKLGYIFQNYVLMNNETVHQNLLISKTYNKSFDYETMMAALDKVGLNSSFLEKKIYQLSGGEQQRVSIARVLLKPAEIILADEPTGNLDDNNKKIIISLLHEMKNSGKIVICATHDQEISSQSDRVIQLTSQEDLTC